MKDILLNWKNKIIEVLKNENLIKKYHNFIRGYIKRLWFELLMIFSIGFVLYAVPYYYFPVEAKLGLINLIIVKFILVSCGICHAHIARKILFPYIKFSEDEHWANNVMVIALYIVIIWSWARGG